MKPYDEDLAYIHDTGFGAFARDSAPHLLNILRNHGIEQGTVVDLGCGSGIWARELLDAGYDVVGADISPQMIAIARRRAPRARFTAASFLDFELPRCRAVTALGEVFSYAFDARNGTRPLGRLFRRIHAALEPGGLLIFDVADLERHRRDSQHHRVGDDWAVIVDFERDKTGRQLTRRIVTFRKRGKCYRRAEEVHRLHLYDGKQLAALLREAGFSVRTVRGYGDYRFWKGAVGFVARR